MSSTNRGAIRVPKDAYLTPAWCVRALLRTGVFPLDNLSVLDPCAGEGNILRVCRDEYSATCQAIEIREECRPALREICGPHVFIADALADQFSFGLDPVVITNPPYSLTHQFIAEWALDGPAAFLLPSSYFRGQKRAEWWQGKEPTRLIQLPRRPAFVAVCKGLSKTSTRPRVKGCGLSYPIGTRGVCECGGNIGDGTDSQDYVWACWGVEPGPRPIQVVPMEWCK